MTWEDPIVADVRRIREDLAARFNFDLSAIFADIRARQSQAGDRLVRLKGYRKAEPSDAPEAAATSSKMEQSLARPR
jgi:hypothetical protein